MSDPIRSRVIHLTDARELIPGPQGEHSARLLTHGTLEPKLSQPVAPNRQTPHEQDEVYVIVNGSGVLVHDGQRDRFKPGDAMFIAAGTDHHFEDFTDDLTVWVLFYGAPGGEVPRQGA